MWWELINNRLISNTKKDVQQQQKHNTADHYDPMLHREMWHQRNGPLMGRAAPNKVKGPAIGPPVGGK